MPLAIISGTKELQATVPVAVTDWQPPGQNGKTNVLVLNPAAGNSTINSLHAGGYADGDSVLLVNASSGVDLLLFPHLGPGAPGNQFANVGGQELQLQPGATCWVTRVLNQWKFS